MDLRTDSFSWDLENLLVPENLDDLFVYSQEGSVQKQAIQTDCITQNEPLDQLQQQQQQQHYHQLTSPSEIGMSNLDQVSASINDAMDINMTAPSESQSQITDITKSVSTSSKSPHSSRGGTKSIMDKYQERREKNNVASRKSREKRKMKNNTILMEIEELTLSNESLKENIKVLEEILEKVKADLFASIVPKKTT